MVSVSTERDEPRRPAEKVPAAVAELQLGTAPSADRAWPPSWFAAATATRTDTAARTEEPLKDGFAGRT
jgi:hypothetical protein